MSGILGIGGGGDAGFYPFSMEQSLRFNDDDTAMLSKTFPSAGNRRTWAWSGWVKRANIGNTHPLFVAGSDGNNVFQLAMQTSTDADRLVFYNYTGSYDLNFATTQVLRDVSSWYHIALLMNTTQSTSSNRVKLYINGGLISDLATSSYPSQNFETLVNSAASHRIGRNFDTATSTKSLDGYVAEVNFVDSPIFTAATTSGSATVTGISSTATLKVGMAVSSSTTSVIPDGTTIASIDSSSQITLSANATATNGSVSLTFSPTIDFFGETKNGIWVAKNYTGPYGTNGFRLPFEDDTTVEGFNTVLYTGTGGVRTVQGVGFQPDLVWIKSRSHSDPHELIDSVRGASKRLRPNDTPAESTASNDGFVSFDSDGFSLDGSGGGGQVNGSGRTYAAWCWDAGTGSAASNSNGTITSSVKANTARGFSIVTYTGNGTNGTVGHGLSAAPTWIIVKNRDDVENWAVWHTGIPITKYLRLNDTPEAKTPTNARWNDTAPTSTVFSVGDTSTGDNEVNASGDDYVAYCWTDISGYSKMGTYTGNGSSTGPTVTTGFKPAFVMTKEVTDTSSWNIYDNTRNAVNPATNVLVANTSNNEGTGTDIDMNSDGFQIKSASGNINTSDNTYIYMAFADTREYAFWTDQSGNNNDFQHTHLEHRDVMLDNPTNNRVTFNALSKNLRYTTTLSEGNKTIHFTAANDGFSCCPSTIFRSEGQAYIEFELDTAGSGNASDNQAVCVFEAAADIDGIGGGGNSGLAAAYNGGSSGNNAVIYDDGVSQGNPTKFTTAGQRIGVYIDYDAGKGWFSHDGTVQTVNGTPDISAGTNPHFTFTANTPLSVGAGGIHSSGTPAKITMHDHPSDWETTPPSAYTAFATVNLPDPGIDPNKGEAPDDYFNTVTYTGTGASTLSITGVGFQPDWVWAKKRSATDNHATSDVVRGVTKTLRPSEADDESTNANGLQSFDSDGFTIGSGSGSGIWGGNSGATYVAWNWKAGGAAVSNDDGDITSSVSASPESGFSIVGYTSNNGSNQTVGHGLSSAPELVINKNRDSNSSNWTVTYTIVDGSHDRMRLNLNTTADADSLAVPTSTVFTSPMSNGDDAIAYCFHSVEGYSKIGTYVGNADTEGPFIYTGFRPAFVLSKIVSGSDRSWNIMDNKREGFNPQNDLLFPNSDTDESNVTDQDLLSNGFKLRTTGEGRNRSDTTYLYLAFAEQPFKYANAR